MPISTLVSLIPETDVTLRPTTGHHAHAAFLAIIRETNPDLSQALHAQTTHKPFTVSPLIAKARRSANRLHIKAGTPCRLRFTFLEDALFADFGRTLLTGQLPTIHLGSAPFQVKQLASSTMAEPYWSQSTTYMELLDSAEDHTTMRIKFYSPTAFRTMTPRGYKSYSATRVDPIRCYQSWLNRWNTFAPMYFDKTTLLNFIIEHVGISEIETRTQALNFGRNTEIGYVGTCTFHFAPRSRRTPHLLLAVNCLADFALYCGTGYKTTMGMGQTRRIKPKTKNYRNIRN